MSAETALGSQVRLRWQLTQLLLNTPQGDSRAPEKLYSVMCIDSPCLPIPTSILLLQCEHETTLLTGKKNTWCSAKVWCKKWKI